MQFELFTLVDISQTNARFSKNDPEWHQQQNYHTVVQTLGLRVNPYIKTQKNFTSEVNDYNFGKLYSGEHKIWYLKFQIEYNDGLNIEMLQEDFNFIPFIRNLGETADFRNDYFETYDNENKNIIFKYVD